MVCSDLLSLKETEVPKVCHLTNTLYTGCKIRMQQQQKKDVNERRFVDTKGHSSSKGWGGDVGIRSIISGLTSLGASWTKSELLRLVLYLCSAGIWELVSSGGSGVLGDGRFINSGCQTPHPACICNASLLKFILFSLRFQLSSLTFCSIFLWILYNKHPSASSQWWIYDCVLRRGNSTHTGVLWWWLLCISSIVSWLFEVSDVRYITFSQVLP